MIVPIVLIGGAILILIAEAVSIVTEFREKARRDIIGKPWRGEDPIGMRTMGVIGRTLYESTGTVYDAESMNRGQRPTLMC